ncbi:hypothetical protein SASPL_152374 [Salvia splendens]|uniref:Helicase ATP-binding domain-containing protein n=1 Tax=Salvia splendens TaxID=180675 RepID=A0A8X8W355_SALSN|nr:hypothetical protein SASPL_152374 [Salvia splendens]
MVEEEEGSPEKEEIGDELDLLEIDTLWRIMEDPSNPPLDNRLANLSRVNDLTGMQTPEDMFWVNDMHNSEASESKRGLLDGFVESAWNPCNPDGEMLGPSPQFSQGNGYFNVPVMLWAEDKIGPSESRLVTMINFPIRICMVVFTIPHLITTTILRKLHLRHPVTREQFDLNSPYIVQQSSDEKGADLAPVETPNCTGTSSCNSFRNAIHNHDSSDFCQLNRFQIKYRDMPASGNETEDPSNIVTRASEVNYVSNGGQGTEWSSCMNYGINSKVKTEEELFQLRRTHPSPGMSGATSVKSSPAVAKNRKPSLEVSEHPGVMPCPSVISATNIIKMEKEVPKFHDCQNKTSDQSNADDDSGLCVLEDMSAPARPDHVAMNESSVGTKHVMMSRSPCTQMVKTHSRRKPTDERVIFRVAEQDLLRPKFEACPPDGALSVSLLKHQRIALSWMAKKETRSACCSGGILADDQGLGKTISTIALILKERAPLSKASKTNVKQGVTEMFDLDDDDGVLGKGHATEGAEHIMVNGYPINNCKIPVQAKGRPSGGTLIVCPTSVLRQWSEELHNKVTKEADLSVLVYYGSNRTKDPLELSKYDVVVTTYAIVSMEVPKQPVVNEHDDLIGSSSYKDYSSGGKRKPPDKKSSKSKKSRSGIDNELLENASGPLAQVGWFRVVLDEAQRTPMQNAIDDLYSYFRFLRHEPYAVFRTFCEQLKEPISKNPRDGYKKLQAVLKTIIPPIETTIKAPSFSSTTDAASVAAFVVSPGKSWMLDSGASTHITGTKSLFSSFSPSSLPSVRLADGNYFPVTGTGPADEEDDCALSAVVSPYQWHCRLGHPSSSDLRSLVPVASVDFNYVARTLMFHMHVPKYLWSDVVLTACFLINKMPSSVLHGDIPFSCLHPDKEALLTGCHLVCCMGIFLFRVGCTCFVHDLTPGLDKLSPRSIKSIYDVIDLQQPLKPHKQYQQSHVHCHSHLRLQLLKIHLLLMMIPTSYQEALKHPLWRAAMDEEMRALLSRGTLLDGEPIIDLPPKTIELKKVEFSKEERDFYCSLEADSRAQFAEYQAAGTLKQNYVNILLMLLRLRQACDHPLLVKDYSSNAKNTSSIETVKKLAPEEQSFLLNCLEGSGHFPIKDMSAYSYSSILGGSCKE